LESGPPSPLHRLPPPVGSLEKFPEDLAFLSAVARLRHFGISLSQLLMIITIIPENSNTQFPKKFTAVYGVFLFNAIG
jgi:hypothetical protein